MICPKCSYSWTDKSRSNPQNATYWKFIVTPFAEFLGKDGYTKDDVHELLKSECNYVIRHNVNKQGFMVEKIIAQSTTILTTKTFGEFLDNCVRYAASQGCCLTLPDDPREE